jgi:hypothetical protein
MKVCQVINNKELAMVLGKKYGIKNATVTIRKKYKTVKGHERDGGDYRVHCGNEIVLKGDYNG